MELNFFNENIKGKSIERLIRKFLSLRLYSKTVRTTSGINCQSVKTLAVFFIDFKNIINLDSYNYF